MITLLTKLFIKDRDRTGDPAVRQQYGMLCGFCGILLNVLLFGGKFFAGSISGSIAITADAFNNLSDAGSSLITLIGFKMAGQKADPGHPFGHGRIEYISGFIVSLVILTMAFDLAKTSIGKILSPEAVAFSPLLIAILFCSILVKLYMALYNRRIGTRIDSAAMRSTAMDSFSDALATAVVLGCTLLSHYTDLHIDGWCGVLVSLFIFYTGINAARDTLSPLLGQAPDPQLVQDIQQTVMSYPHVTGIHDLVVHNYGPGRLMISLHAEVPSNGDILLMHDTIDLIERQLQNDFHCEAVIHMDPIATDDALTAETCRKVCQLLQSIDPAITLHDFRMVSGATHTNLIFDAVVPHRFHLSDEQVCAAIYEKVQKLEGNYFAVVTIDHSFIA